MIRLVDDAEHPWEVVTDGRPRGRVRSLSLAHEFEYWLRADAIDTEREHRLETTHQRQLDLDEEYQRRHVEDRP